VEPPTPWRVLESAAPQRPTSGEPEGAAGNAVPWVPLAALALAGALAVAAFAVATSGSATTLQVEMAAASDGAAPVPEPSRQARVLVEVGGAVLSPGVYELPADARVADAIAAAGGLGPRVDAARADREINLAARLADGTEIHVPSRDDPPGVNRAAPQKAEGSGADRTPVLVDVNRASSSELEALPGIGPATAARIISAREQQPFTSVDELRARKVLGAATFEKVRELVTAGP